MTEIELGDSEHGYHAIDTPDNAEELHSLASNLYLAIILASIPKKTNGALSLTPKKKNGTPLQSRAEGLPVNQSGPYLPPPKGTIDKDQVIHDPGSATTMEIKEWQAIMNYLKSLPTKNAKGVTVLVMDDRANENRSIDVPMHLGSGV